MQSNKYSIYLKDELIKRIDDLADCERRSRSNTVEMLLLQALDGNGHPAPHPRIAELAGDWLRGLVTGDELAREIAALVLTGLAVSDKQMRLEIPTEVQA